MKLIKRKSLFGEQFEVEITIEEIQFIEGMSKRNSFYPPIIEQIKDWLGGILAH